MSTPKYKERPGTKHRRLGWGKPHIYWSELWGEWLYADLGINQTAREFCEAQDLRWTPRDKP